MSGADIPPHIRLLVRERDMDICRMCGVGNHYRNEIHHIIYRSHGGPHELWNLVYLGQECHARAHSNPALWRPLLLEVAKLGGVTAFQFKRWQSAAERRRSFYQHNAP